MSVVELYLAQLFSVRASGRGMVATQGGRIVETVVPIMEPVDRYKAVCKELRKVAARLTKS